MDKEQLLSVKDVANWLGVSVETVRRLTKRGELPAKKIGWQWRYQQKDIQAYLDQKINEGKVETLVCTA